MKRLLIIGIFSVQFIMVLCHQALADPSVYFPGDTIDEGIHSYRCCYCFDIGHHALRLFCALESDSGWSYIKPSPAVKGMIVINDTGTLCFFTEEGKMIQKIKTGNHGFDWSPDGSRYVFSTGKGSLDFVESTGTWIHDVKTGKKTKIYNGGVRLYWSRFNKKIYIENDPEGESIVAYDLTTGKIEKTNYEDLYFSPDGKYYIAPNWETLTNIKLIVRETGEDIAPNYRILSPEYNFASLLTLQWIRPNVITMQVLHSLKTDILYLDTGRTLVVERFLAMSEDGKKVYTASADLKKVEEKNIEDVQVVFSEKDGMVKK